MFNRSVALLLLSITVSLAFTSCVTPELPPLEGEISNIAGEFVSLLVKEEYNLATDYFDTNLQSSLPATDLRRAWRDLLVQVGPYIKQVVRIRDELEGYDAVTINTEFEKAFIDILLVFNDRNRIISLWFDMAHSAGNITYTSPFYAEKDKFKEINVVVGEGEWELPGTLTLPVEEGRYPAVILVHGSGPQDRDYTYGPSKPFKDLAEGLASQGIAVLRYEKRTLKYNEKFKDIKDLTVWEETVQDALAAVSLLKDREEIDPLRIFLLGHGLGGTLAPRIAAEDKDIAGLIIMAGGARPLEDLIWDQTNYLANLDGFISSREKAELIQLEEKINRVKDPELSELTRTEDLPMELPASYWLDLRNYNPVTSASMLSLPMLILQGERDFQVTMEDFAIWDSALGSNKNVELISYPLLNHLFLRGEGQSSPKEYQLFSNIDMMVIMEIAAWIKR